MDDGDCGAIWWNEDWQGKLKCSEKTCLSATLFTTNPTCPDLGSNPGRRGEINGSYINRIRKRTMDSNGSLPLSQEPYIGPYPEVVESS
jgi:hypothetical protein